jgi:hypothetical protein
MHAVILERNKLVGRRAARAFLAAGVRVTVVEEPAQATALLADADVLCADTFDGDYVAEHVRGKPLRGVLWTAEPLKRSLRYLLETPRIEHVLGRRDFDSPPRGWELLVVARRLVTGTGGTGSDSSLLPLAAYLDWGFSAIDLDVHGTSDRDRVVARVQEFVTALTVPKRVAEMLGELAHELIMNAVYDAPVDRLGHPKFAADRKAEIQLADSERPVVRLGTDGSRIVFQIRDPFGRLERRHVLDALARGLTVGELDRTHGGAGLGMTVCHHASSALFFDVAIGRYTEVTAVFELDLNLRELRTHAKSLHFWSA